ncbi:NIN-like protein [Artemisia annua]|uniref:NIN-like protein n=1 Tax=Artemisia annua TaxID=35608 RepID=A0A2U1KE65_ARTAN|nr:NIN-like protein [Artemisia annua]
MMVEPSTIDTHTIKERITSALKEFRFRDKGVLVQFWSPVAVRNRWLLTTWDQPFGIGGADEGLYSFRFKSELHAIVVDVEDIEELHPPGRVYSQKLPEWSLDVDGGRNKYGYIDLPVFESSSDSCVGVLEIITSSNYVDYAFEVQEVSRALKNQNLKSPHVFEDPTYSVDERRRYELDGILKVLKAVCDDQELPLAQTWARSGHASFVADSGNIERSCSSFNRSCIGKVCMSTYDLPFYVRDLTTWDFFKSCRERHLENSQGVVGRSFSSRGSWFSRDVTELDEDNYPLFFLPTHSNDDADVQRLMKSVKQQIQNASCMRLDVMSAPQVIGGHFILSWDLDTPPLPITLLTDKEVPQDSEGMKEENVENEPSKSLAVGTSQSIALHLEHGIRNFDTNPGTVRKKRKRKRSESSITSEEIKKHFDKPMDEAAAILNVSRSTLKRICRDRGIPRWPYRIGIDKSDSLMKSNQTDIVIHTSDGSLAPVFGVSSEPLGTTAVSHDPATLTEKGKSDSLMKSNQTDIVVHTSDGSLAPVFGVSSEPLGTTAVSHDPATLTEKGKSDSLMKSNQTDIVGHTSDGSLAPVFGVSSEPLGTTAVSHDPATLTEKGKSDSLMKSNQTDIVGHTSDGSLAPVFGVSSEPLGTTAVSHDPATLTEKGKHASPTRTNPPDDTIVASRVENVVIKATYEKNTVKFSFCILDGLVKLKDLIARRFQLKHECFRLKYKDEDGDMILILCDNDLPHAILSTSEPPDSKAVIKLFVQPVSYQSSDA